MDNIIRVDQYNSSDNDAPTSNPVDVNGSEEDVLDWKLIYQCAYEFIGAHSELSGLIAEDVLKDEDCRKEIEARAADKVAKAKEAAEKEAKRVQDKAKAEFHAKLAAAKAALRAERKLKPDEIKEQLSSVTAAVSQPKNQETTGKSIMDLIMSRVPPAVLELKKTQGGALLACVYKSADEAVLFRSKLITCANRYHEALRSLKLEPQHREVLRSIAQLFQPVIDKTAEVIKAWGLDPKVARVKDPDTFYRIGREMAADTRFAGMVKMITPEDIKAAETAKMSEQEEEVDRVAVRDEIVDKLLKAGFDADAASKLARKISKQNHDECDGDADAMLRRAAFNRLVEAEPNDVDQEATVRRIAQAGGASYDALVEMALQQKRRQEAVSNLLNKAGCEETAETRARQAAKKKHKPKNDGKKKGK